MTNGDFLIPPPVQPKRGPSCWLIGGLSCLGLTVMLIVILAFGAYQALRTPRGKQFEKYLGKVLTMSSKIPEVEKKIITIRGALIRYDLKNGTYPNTLEQLEPDYLPDNTELHCALDTNPDPHHTSFTYYKPAPNAQSSTVVLSFSWSISMNISNAQGTSEEELLTETLGGIMYLSQYQDGKLISRVQYPGT